MNIVIKTKNLELTESLEKFISKRLEGLKKFIKVLKNDSQEVMIEVEKETKHHKKGDVFRAEAIIKLPGQSLVARAHGEDLGKVVTETRDEMEREIRKYKTMKIEKPRREQRKAQKQDNL